jgi:hypothetical protein
MTRLLLLPLLFCTSIALSQTAAPTALKDKFPQLRVQAKVGTKRDQVSGSSYQQTMSISPEAVIEAAVTKPMPAAEAVMIIIVMDTRAKYVQKRDVYKVLTAETMPVPAAPSGARRTFEFRPSKTTFDTYRDTSNIGGEVYKWFIFGLRDAENKQLVYFETNCPALDKHTKAKPETRDQFLKLSTGAELDLLFK